MPLRRRRIAALLAAAVTGFIPAAAAPPSLGPGGDGYLTRPTVVLVYPGDSRFESSERGLTLQREVDLFAAYLWRYSGRRLSVEPRIHVVHRSLSPREFRNYGSEFGFLLDRSPEVKEDLERLAESPESLLILYDPLPGLPPRLAGRTFFPGEHSSIPLRPVYFQADGFYRPLHLVLAHEFLHQVDLAFSRLKYPAEFLDPDGAGAPGYPRCIDAGGGDLTLRTVLQYNRACEPVRYQLLAPDFGTWIVR